jgi:hypothetical protein
LTFLTFELTKTLAITISNIAMDNIISVILIVAVLFGLKNHAKDNPGFTTFGMTIDTISKLAYIAIGINLLLIMLK